ncbi:MAG TPA: tRNA lysidine(34) synthetase TilS [Gemmatimonadales bacterium]|nr:tRNA lysidine(34) synthetase TilS [Gemmatimonadales bacterium]
MTTPLAARVARELDGLGVASGRWLVAVSGGPDSVALLHLLADAAPSRSLALVVAHADHGIHPDSAHVAERVTRLAEALGLPITVGQLELGATATETEARAARYVWLRAESTRLGALGIVTGHHADDQAETVLMRVLRGSGPAGLAGMPRRSPDVVRPLLPFRREELAQYLLERGLDAWRDPANADPRHLRSWIRIEVLPTLERRLPDVTARLLALAGQARAERDAWDEVLDRLAGLEVRREQGRISLDAGALAALDGGLPAQLVRTAARRLGAVVSVAAARRAVRLVRTGSSGQLVDLADGWSAELAFGRLVLGPPVPTESDRPLPASGACRWGGWTLTCRSEPAGLVARSDWHTWLPPGETTVGASRTGERLRPLGGTGHRLIARLLQEAKVPRGERLAWPVLRRGGIAIWVPGVSRSGLHVPEAGQEAVRIDVQRT